MAEATLELSAILDAAERAAAAQDFVSAERHLRQAAELQEIRLGPGHHDLANTLNNLGIVCEHLGKSADAEACYRRAYRIASTSLPPEHALVQTSGQNLRDFCAAMGKPFELREPESPELDTFASELKASKTAAPERPLAPRPQPAPIAAPVKPTPVAQAPVARAPAAPVRPPRPTEVRAPEAPAPPPTAAMRTASAVSPPSSRPTAAIVVGAVLLLGVAGWWFGYRDTPGSTAPASSRIETAPPREEPVTPRAEPVTPRAEPVAPREQPVAPREQPAPPAVNAAPERTPPAATGKPTAAVRGDVSLAEAKLCRSLSTSNWACTPATSPAAPGAFFFYTRVQSQRDTTVQHRWLMNGRLLRSVNLRIGANPGAGYRTYSRNTVIAERRGDWTVELRNAEGALLHEERFTIQ